MPHAYGGATAGRLLLLVLVASVASVAVVSAQPSPSPSPQRPTPIPPPGSPPVVFVEEVSSSNAIVAGVVGGVLGLMCCILGWCLAKRSKRFGGDDGVRLFSLPNAAT